MMWKVCNFTRKEVPKKLELKEDKKVSIKKKSNTLL